MSNPSTAGNERLAYQFKGSEKFEGFIESFLLQLDELYNSGLQLLNERDLDTAIGLQLDGIGDIVGIKRPQGQSDSIYLWTIKAKILINNTDMTVAKMLNTLSFIFSGKTIRYSNYVNLSPKYVIPGTLTTEELIIFDLIPTTLGVGVAYVSVVDYETAFSFSNDTGLGFSTLANPASGGNFARLI